MTCTFSINLIFQSVLKQKVVKYIQRESESKFTLVVFIKNYTKFLELVILTDMTTSPNAKECVTD